MMTASPILFLVFNRHTDPREMGLAAAISIREWVPADPVCSQLT
jgi:hypothetical protein